MSIKTNFNKSITNNNYLIGNYKIEGDTNIEDQDATDEIYIDNYFSKTTIDLNFRPTAGTGYTETYVTSVQISRINNYITIFIPSILITNGTNSTKISSTTGIDEEYRPSIDKYALFASRVASSYQVANLQVSTAGIISYSTSLDYGNGFTINASNCGAYALCFSYII